MYCMAYSTSFSIINNILISVNNSSTIPVFFKHACHDNVDAD